MDTQKDTTVAKYVSHGSVASNANHFVERLVESACFSDAGLRKRYLFSHKKTEKCP